MLAVSSTAFPRSLLKTLSQKITQSFTVFLCLLLALQPLFIETARAQEIIIDPNGNIGFTPQVRTGGSVPIVDITPPNTGGVSLNQYERFDVGPNGVVLNNSQGEVDTQLVGTITGNPNLTNGTASTIVNEVTSTQNSTLTGSVEVAGDRADVIIANPNGITCNGCSFINTATGTLTTGVPVVNGANVRLDVTQGGITIGRAGLDGAGTGLSNINLIGRTVVVDGKVTAIEGVTVHGGAQSYDLTGQSRVSYLSGAGTTPDFVVDGTEFGAMEAGRIQIIGNELGLGVRTLGALQSTSGNVNITTRGDTVVRSVSAQGDVNLQVLYDSDDALLLERDITSATGTVLAYSLGNINTTDRTGLYGFSGVTVTSANENLTFFGVVQSGADIDLFGKQRLTFSAYGSASGTVRLQGEDVIEVADATIVANRIEIDNRVQELRFSDAALFTTTDVVAQTVDFHLGQDVIVDGLTASDGSNLVVTASGNFYNAADLRALPTASISYAGNLYNQLGGVIQEDTLQITSDGEVHNAGVIYAVDALEIDAAAVFNNATGAILSKSIDITTSGLLLNKGTITSEGDLNLISDVSLVNQGYVQAAQAWLTAPEISNTGTGEIRLRDLGEIAAADRFANSGIVGSLGDLEINTAQFENNSLISVESTLTAQAGEFSNQGTLTAGALVDLEATGDLLNTGHIISYNDLTLQSDSIVLNKGILVADQTLRVTGALFDNAGPDALVRAKKAYLPSSIRNAGEIYLVEKFSLGTIDLFENDGVFASQGHIDLTGRDELSEVILHEDSLLIAGLQPDDETQTLLASRVKLNFSNAQLDGRIAAGSLIELLGPTHLIINGALDAGENMRLTADLITFKTDAIVNAGAAVFLNATDHVQNHGTLVAGNFLRTDPDLDDFTSTGLIKARYLSQVAINGTFKNTGVFITDEGMTLYAAEIVNQGHLQSGMHMSLHASRTEVDPLGETVTILGDLTHSGTISSGDTATFTANTLTLAEGSYLTGERLIVRADRMVSAGNMVINGSTSSVLTIAQDLQQSGMIYTSGNLNIIADEIVSEQDSLLGAEGVVWVTADTNLNVEGAISGERIFATAPVISSGMASSLFAASRLEITTAGRAGLYGELVGGNILVLTADIFDLRGAGYGKTVTLTATGDGVSTTRGALYASGTLSIDAASGQFTNHGLTEAQDQISISANTFKNNDGAQLSSTELTIETGTWLTNYGTLSGAAKTSLAAGTVLSNRDDGRIESVSLGLTSQSFVNEGEIDVYGFFGSVGGSFRNEALIDAETYFGLEAGSVRNVTGAVLDSGDHLYIQTSGAMVNEVDAELRSQSIDLRLKSLNNSGVIEAADVINVGDLTGGITNTLTGRIDAPVIALFTEASVTNEGRIGQRGDATLPNADHITISAGNALNNLGQIEATDVSLLAGLRLTNENIITAHGGTLGLKSETSSVTNRGELHGDTILVEAAVRLENEALISGIDSVFVTAGHDIRNESLDGSFAEIKAKTVVLEAGNSIFNTAGKLFGSEVLALEVLAGDIQNDGQITGPNITLIAGQGDVSSTEEIISGGSIAIEAENIRLSEVVRATDLVSLTSTAHDVEVNRHIETDRLLVNAARYVKSHDAGFRGSELTQIIAGDIQHLDGNALSNGPWERKLGILGTGLHDIYVELTNGGFGVQNGHIRDFTSNVHDSDHIYERTSLTASGSIALIASGDILINNHMTAGNDLYIRSSKDVALRWATFEAGDTLHAEAGDRLVNHKSAKLKADRSMQLLQEDGWFHTSEWLRGSVIDYDLSVAAKTIIIDSSHRFADEILYLRASEDIRQTNQVITAREITYGAGRDILVRFDPFAWRDANPNASSTGYMWDVSTAGLKGRTVMSSRGITFYAGRDITLQSGKMYTHRSIDIVAGRNFLSEAIYLESDRIGNQTVNEEIVVPKYCGFGEARVQCGTQTVTRPVTIAVESVPENVGWSFSSKYKGVQSGHIATHVGIRELRAYENQIHASDNISIVAGDSANFVGTRLSAGNGDITIEALDGGINMLAAPGYWSYDYSVSGTKKKFGIYKENFTLNFTELKDIYKPTQLLATNGDITLRATGDNGSRASIFSAGTKFDARDIDLYTPNGNISAGTYAERSISDTQYISSGSLLGIAKFGSKHVKATREIEINYGNDLYADNILSIAAPRGTLSITGGTLHGKTVNLTAARLQINAAINSSRETFYSNRDNMITITTIQAGVDQQTAHLPEIFGDVVFNIPQGNTVIEGYEGVTLNNQLINVIGTKTFDNETLGLATPEDLANAQTQASAVQQQFTRQFELPGASDGEQFAYLDTLVQDYGATYHDIVLRDHRWYDKQVQLNPAFRALLTAVVAAYITPALVGGGATGAPGIITNLGEGLAGTGVSAATTELVVGVIDGTITGDLDVGEVLSGAILAGASAQISNYVNDEIFNQLNLDGYTDLTPTVTTLQDFSAPALLEKAGEKIVNQVTSNVVYGQEPFEGLDDLGRTFLVSETLALSQFGIGELGSGSDTTWEGSVGHLLLHGGVGCLALEALDGNCTAGFFAGASSSVLAGSNLTDEQKLQLAPVVGSLAGYVFSGGDEINVSFGGTISQSAIINNYLTHAQWLDLINELEACGEDTACEGDVFEEYRQTSLDQQSAFQACIEAGDSACVASVRADLEELQSYQIDIGARLANLGYTRSDVTDPDSALHHLISLDANDIYVGRIYQAWAEEARFDDYAMQNCSGVNSVDCLQDYAVLRGEEQSDALAQIALGIAGLVPIVGVTDAAFQCAAGQTLGSCAGIAAEALGPIGDVLKIGTRVLLRKGDETVEVVKDATGELKIVEGPASLQGLTPDQLSYQRLLDGVDGLDVSTGPNQSVFYSGTGAREAAESYAFENGLSTLEQTPGGQYLDDLQLFEGTVSDVGGDQAVHVWSRTSANYASQASGQVTAIVNNPRPNSIFLTQELPTLLQNQNVTQITVRSTSGPQVSIPGGTSLSVALQMIQGL